MTRSQMVLWSALAGLLALIPAGSAWAASASQVPDPGVLLEANSQAQGARINGNLSVFYTLVAPLAACTDAGSPTVDMHIALQGWEKKVSTSRTTGKIVRNQCYFSLTAQRTVIEGVINSQLVPKFGYSTSVLKDASNLVQDEGGPGTGTDGNPWFLMMDFTLAAN